MGVSRNKRDGNRESRSRISDGPCVRKGETLNWNNEAGREERWKRPGVQGRSPCRGEWSRRGVGADPSLAPAGQADQLQKQIPFPFTGTTHTKN